MRDPTPIPSPMPAPMLPAGPYTDPSVVDIGVAATALIILAVLVAWRLWRACRGHGGLPLDMNCDDDGPITSQEGVPVHVRPAASGVTERQHGGVHGSCQQLWRNGRGGAACKKCQDKFAGAGATP